MRLPLNSIVEADCISGMQQMPAASVDLLIADPPYNLSKGSIWKWDNSVPLPGLGGNWSKVMESWDDMPLLDYLQFTVGWLSEAKRVVKPTGSLWVCGTYHNIGIINFALQALSVEIINEVVWYKRNSFPNLSGRRLTASHETLLWAHTGKRRQYRFNYDESKAIEHGWDRLKERGKQLRSVWDIPNNKGKDERLAGKHPTQKPLRLFSRIIGVSGRAGGVMLTPFAGSGSECVAALRAGMSYIGFEIEARYAEMAKERLLAETPSLSLQMIA